MSFPRELSPNSGEAASVLCQSRVGLSVIHPLMGCSAFNWGQHQVSPLLLVHQNHQQDAAAAARLRWEGLVAGTDGNVDERTE